MKKLRLDRNGVVTEGRRHVAPPPKKDPPLKQDDRLFLSALDKIMEKHTDRMIAAMREYMENLPVASSTERSTMVEQSASGTVAKAKRAISIDDSTFVVDQKLDGVEKGFEELTEKTKTQDVDASKTVNKLRNLKKGK